MIRTSLKALVITTLISSILYAADDTVIYKGYLNITYDSSKNSIMAGSTTATAKGYSAMGSNPAGLSTNHNAAIYARAIELEVSDEQDKVITKNSPTPAIGVLYDSFGVEVKKDNYALGGAAYGYESGYGLFSFGVSYLYDMTDLTQKSTSVDQKDEFATGNYITYGAMWQKSFIDDEDFYAIYLGYSHKNSSQYSGDNNVEITPISPSRSSFGLGLETNAYDTAVLFTYDYTTEYWQSVSETLSGSAYGLKWMINQKFAVAGGMKNQVFSGSILKDIKTNGAGFEFGFLGLHTVIGVTERIANYQNGEQYLKETAVHIDAALTF